MGKLKAEQLKEDPRIAEGKRLILEALSEHRSDLTEIKPADPSRQVDYAGFLEEAASLRGAPLWLPYIGSGFGSGPFVELADGSVKLDLINGIGVYYSHGTPEITEALLEGAMSDLVMQGNLQQNREQTLLIEELSKGCGLPHCFLTTSGAMALENGLKIAFQKHAPKKRLLAFENAFHGRTCALASITDRPQYREGVPAYAEVDYLPFHPGDALGALEALLKKHPNDYAAFLFEPIQGEGGIKTAPHDFFAPLLKQMRAHNIAVIADEVQTFGRTNSLLASQSLGLADHIDILTIGKLGQTCATLFTKDYNPKPGLLSQTFTSSTSALLVARVILRQLLSGHFGHDGKNVRIHKVFEEGMKKLEPRVSGPYGVGLMSAFTLGKGESETAATFVRTLFDKGVISFVAGANPTRIRLLLPPCLQEEHLKVALTLIEEALP